MDLDEQRRQLAALTDRTSGAQLSRLAQMLKPAFDVNSIIGPKVPALSELLASLDTSRQVARMLETQGAFAQIAEQRKQLAKTFAPMDMLEAQRAFASISQQREDLATAFAPVALSPMVDLVRNVDRQYASIFDSVQQMAKAIQSSYMQRIGESFRAITASNLYGVGRFKETFFDYLRDLRPLEWLAARELTERGWWLVPTWSADEVGELIAERERRKCAMGPVLTTRYQKQKCLLLGRMVRAWTLPEFAAGGRKGLFEETLAQHRHGKYQAVILSLEPQIEGILKDFLLEEGICTERDFKKTPTPELFKKHVSAPREPSIGGFAHQLELMYSHFTWVGPATGRKLRRHPHLHGREVPRNSSQDALRMWLMLETLHFHLARVRRMRREGAA